MLLFSKTNGVPHSRLNLIMGIEINQNMVNPFSRISRHPEAIQRNLDPAIASAENSFLSVLISPFF